ncbi:MAG: GPR endopeptidase [Clostridia bacterium]|nr:GPR endopeptidase [Clostridia bacterium]
MYNFRTDMADERRDIYKKANNLEGDIPGIQTIEKSSDENIKSSIVKILNEEGEKAIGKPIGTYVTIDVKNLKLAGEEDLEKASSIISEELKVIINEKISNQDEILVVGLGNQFVTPDSLGPKVVSEIEITRHLLKYAPECVVPGSRAVSAVAPGVLGTTGIETLEIIKGIVDNVKPKLLIVIDSLASKSIERISSTIQISDTGIVPGAGVGNTRKELSKNTLGIPVVAIGVPMVVDLATITDDCLDIFIEKLQDEAKSNEYLNNLRNQDNYEEIKSALIPRDYNMIVTPKEVDDLIENMKEIISRSINNAI